MEFQVLNTLPRDVRNVPLVVTHPFRGKRSSDLTWEQARARFRYYVNRYGDGYVSLEQMTEETTLAFYNASYRKVYANPFKTGEQWLQAYQEEKLAHWKGAVRLQANIFNNAKTEDWPGVEQELWERYWASFVLCFLYSDQEKAEGLYQSSTSLWLDAHRAGFNPSKWQSYATTDENRVEALLRQHEGELPPYQDKKAGRLVLFHLLQEYRKEHPVPWTMPMEIL